jgi:hypothetical protein
MSQNQGLKIIGLFLIIAACILSGAELYQNYRGTVIYADETYPVIKLSASTHGKIAYPSAGKPTVLCFVEENMGLDSVTTELRTPGGFLGLGSESIETITLDYVSKTGDIYQYRGTFTESLSENIKYKLIYRAHDRVDLSDSVTTELELVQIKGRVKVNGIEVKNPTQTIYSKDLTLFIEVEITQGKNSIDHLALYLNGERLQTLEAAVGGTWVTTYELPKDGQYSFIVEILAAGGESIQLASFSVDLGSSLNPWVLAGVVGLGVLVSSVLLYMKRQEA